MDETTTATSGRAASGGRVEKIGGQKKIVAQNIDTEEEAEAGAAAVRRRE